MDRDTHASQEVVLVEWEAPAFNDLNRGPFWYAIAGLLLAGLMIYGFRSGSMSMVLALLALGLVFLMVHHKKPQHKKVRITDMGVHYGEKFYPYNHLKHFWIVYHPPYIHCLYLKLSGKNAKLIRLQLNGQVPQVVRQLLSKEMKELEAGGEPFFDALSRILRLQ